MSDYKLTYFNGLGLGEFVRLVFVAAEVPFEDVRIDYLSEWPALKPTATYGVLPTLETGGHTYFQSIAIARHLARKFGLAGKTELEQFKADIVIDTFDDTIRPVYQFYSLKDDDKRKDELRKTYIEETLPKHLDVLEKLLKSNKNGDGYFVGDSLTWADLHILDFAARFKLLVKTELPLDKYPKLKSLYERIGAQKKIAEWIAKRPDSWF